MEVVLGVSAALGAVLVGQGLIVARCYRRIGPEQALVVSRPSGEPVVHFGNAMVYPILHQAEVVELTVKAVAISRTGRQGVVCRDGVRADVEAAFFVRINRTREDVLKVVQSVGAARASSQKALEELFVAKFSAGLDQLCARMDFEDLLAKREVLEDLLLESIGQDLNGFALDDLAVSKIAQTPLEMLDPNDISDARGIEKILRITLEKAKRAEELRGQLAKLDTV